MPDAAHKVLFLRNGNSARPIIAECLMIRLGAGQLMSVHRGVPDSAAVERAGAVKRAAFADTMRYLFPNLPFYSHGRSALQRCLVRIGQVIEQPAETV